MFKEDKFLEGKFDPIKLLLVTGVIIGLVTGVTFLFMFLWNAILPDVTGVKPLNFWKALGLLLIAKILFGGFRRRRSPSKKSRRHWKSKWMEMDPEERKEAKERWKAHCRNRRKK